MAKKHAVPNVIIEMTATNIWIEEAYQWIAAPLLRHSDSGRSTTTNFP